MFGPEWAEAHRPVNRLCGETPVVFLACGLRFRAISPLAGPRTGTCVAAATLTIVIALSSTQHSVWTRTGRNAAFRLLILIWVCFPLRGVFYSSMLPLWEGYDEFSHFAYVQQLAFPGTLPIVDQSTVSKEIEESVRLAPLPWGVRSMPSPSVTHEVYWTLPAEEREMREGELRSMPREWAREPSADKSLFWEALQPPLYYWLASGVLRMAANQSLAGRVILVRWFSVAMASLLIPLGFLVARQVLGDSGVALGVVVLVAAMPELMIVVSRVANDSLATPIYTLVVFLVLRWLDSPASVQRAFFVGLAFGFGMLTKVYFLTALPVLVLIPLAALWRRKEKFRICVSSILAATPMVVVAGWWFLRNHRLAGMWVLQPGAELIRGVPFLRVLGRAGEVDWRNVVRSVQISHIWFGDWSFLQVRGWMYKVIWDIFRLACLGLAVCAWRLFQGRGRCAIRDSRHFLVFLGLYVLFCIGIAYDALLVFLLFHVSTTDGRYLYAPIVVEVILVTAGLLALVPRGYGPWVLPTLTFFFVLLELYATHFVALPYYSGLIAHTSNGALATFHISMLKDIPIRFIIERLLVNKPQFLNTPIFVLSWILFLASTLSLPVVSRYVSRISPVDNAGQVPSGNQRGCA